MPENQNIENLLNLALDATEGEREKSLELDVGYEPQTRTWELIVRYSGSLERIRRELPEAEIAELSNGFAIIRLSQDSISYLANQPEIEFIEKPKRLYFEIAQGKSASCMTQLQIEDPSGMILLPGTVRNPLLGKGILVAVIDSGVDYAHPEFRNPDGTTRILAIWDQTVDGNPPEGFQGGTEFTREELNEALQDGSTLPIRDFSGHGTQVLGIAAGNSGAAPQAEILVVKLGNPLPDSFPKTTQLMEAVEYVYRKAQQYQLPVAVNISFGTVYGPHNGLGLLDTYLDAMAGRWKSVLAIGTGNEGEAAGHSSGRLLPGRERIVEMGVAPGEISINVQLWKNYTEEFQIYLTSPGGQTIGPLQETIGPQRFVTGDTELLVYYGEPKPYSISQEIYFDFLPRKNYVESGVWRFRFVPQRIVEGRYDLWLPSASVLNTGTRFYQPTPDNTLTIPSTAGKAIAVGAYDSRRLIYAPFSGRGNSEDGISVPGLTMVRPDLAAPGVDITTAAPGGGYAAVTGTSFATPFVTGAAAMMMQWGITDGNDPYLYGEKVKAYLQRGARPLPGFTEYPNNQVGYGENVIIRSHGRKSVKSSVSVHFPKTETKHFFHYFEENLPGLDAKWHGKKSL